jgi:hypothetical protein
VRADLNRRLGGDRRLNLDSEGDFRHVHSSDPFPVDTGNISDNAYSSKRKTGGILKILRCILVGPLFAVTVIVLAAVLLFGAVCEIARDDQCWD